MDNRPDATLVTGALAGQPDAFAALVRKYQDYAYGVAIGMLSDFDLARDVVQEAFLCAYRDLRKLKDPDRFGGWLRGIVRHTAHRALRELEQVRSLADQMQRTVPSVAPTPSPDQSAQDAERRELVRRALEGLTENHREAVSLHYVNGLSYADIAGFLDVTEATVQGRLQRARAKLRRELAMVEETFKEQELPEDFSSEIKQLLDAAEVRGRQHEEAIRRLAEIGAPAVDPLCEALGDPRIPVRRAAACALCTIGDARALRPILRLLYGEDYWMGNALLRTGRALAIPGVREALLEIVREGQRHEQHWALHALAHIAGDDDVFDCLCRAFRDPTSGNRYQALWVLCRARPELGTELVTEALNDPDPDLRGHVWWLAHSGGFLPPIDACLKAFDSRVRPAGQRGMAVLILKHGEEGRRVLERILQTGTSTERMAAAMGLASEGHAGAFDVLKQELLGKPPDRMWAKQVSLVLARHYGRKLTAWIEADRPDLTGAHGVMWTLARSRPQDTPPSMEQFYRDGAPAVRQAALRMLARQQPVDLLPELRRCLREGRPRKLAQEAFWQMHRLGDAAMPIVTEMLTSDHWTERKAALSLLRRWNKLTPEQQAHAKQDPHAAVRHAANWHPRWQKAARWHSKWGKRIPDAPDQAQ